MVMSLLLPCLCGKEVPQMEGKEKIYMKQTRGRLVVRFHWKKGGTVLSCDKSNQYCKLFIADTIMMLGTCIVTCIVLP